MISHPALYRRIDDSNHLNHSNGEDTFAAWDGALDHAHQLLMGDQHVKILDTRAVRLLARFTQERTALAPTRDARPRSWHSPNGVL